MFASRRALTLLLPLLLSSCQWLGSMLGTTAGTAPAEAPLETRDTTPVHSAGQLVGMEVFISIGGIGAKDHSAVLNALQAGYARNGYRVHWVIMPNSIEPLARQMVRVAAEYRQASATATQIVFHHTGHGWNDHISYQDRTGRDLGQTLHSEIFARLSSNFPSGDQPFVSTRFVVVLDACGQGAGARGRVVGRPGLVLTSTPLAAPASACAANDCAYVCPSCDPQTVPGYEYSVAFGTALAGADFGALSTAHGAGSAHLRTVGCPGTGYAVEYRADGTPVVPPFQ